MSLATLDAQPADSGYVDVDRSGDPAAYIRRLDAVGQTAFWQALKRHSWGLLRLGPGSSVLDVGCGTGDDVRALAGLVGGAGRAVGVDRSAAMLAEARRRSEAAPAAARLEFHLGDARRLEFADASFDACRAERLLQHLADPGQALAEMVRVTRPDGRLVAIEPDYSTLVVEGADAGLTRRILDHRRAHFRSGQIGRQLPLLLARLGVGELSIARRSLSTERLTQDEAARLRRVYADRACAAGAISEAERSAWLTQLHAAGRRAQYRQALTVFVVAGTRR